MPKTKSKLVNVTGKKKMDPLLKSFIKTQILVFIIYIAVFLICCAVSLALDLNGAYDYYVSLGCFVLLSFISGFLGGIKQRKKGILSGLIYALPANIVVLVVSLIVSAFAVDFNLFISAVSLLIASMIGGVIAVNQRQRR